MIKRYFYIFCASMFIMTAPTKGVNAKVLEKKLLELERQQKAPPGLNYQAALRGTDGNPLANTTVTMRFSIQTAIDNSGILEWEETQSVSTDDLGLMSTVVGQGTRTGGNQADFVDIPWPSANMYLKVEIDQGSGFVDLGTTQLMSVPYAFAADNGISDEQSSKLDGIENNAEENVQSDWNQTDMSADDFIVGKPIIPTDVNELADADGLLTPNAFSGSFDDLTNVPSDLADGDDVNDADADANNEIQDLQLVGNNLTITNNGTATTIDLTPYLDDTDTNTQLSEAEVDGFVSNNGYLTSEVDGDVTNEIQDLQLVGNNLTITNNGTATTIDLTPYLDDTDTNTQLSEAEVDGFVSNNGYLTSEVDGDAANEIQDLQLVGNSLTITNNGSATTIDLTPYLDDTDTNTQLSEAEVDGFVSNNGYLTSEVDGDVTNEIQDLQFSGNIISLSGDPTPTFINLSNYDDNASDDFNGVFGSLIGIPANLDTDVTDDFSGDYNDLINLPSIAFESNNNILSNNGGDLANESFIIGSSQFNDTNSATHDSRMFFEKATGAFRVGTVNGTQWDTRGTDSFATGINNSATGTQSSVTGGNSNAASGVRSIVAGGFTNIASGQDAFMGGGRNNISGSTYSVVAGGRNNNASAERSSIGGGFGNTTAGRHSTIPGGAGLYANTFGETALGIYNTSVAGNASGISLGDRLLVVGNGTGTGNRSDALIMLKNGNTTLNGQLTLSDGMNPFTFPNADGNNGQVLSTDGSGNLTWQFAGGGSFSGDYNDLINVPSLSFSTVSNVILNSNPADESFLIGSTQFNDDGDVTHDKRMFFEKSTGAFRVGGTSTTSWDTRGTYSFAAGRLNYATGNQSTVSGGFNNTSSGTSSFIGGGQSNVASGSNAGIGGGYGNTTSAGYSFVGGGRYNQASQTYATVSGGYRNQATGRYSSVLGGVQLRANSFGEVATGFFNTDVSGNLTSFIATDRLLTVGNGTSNALRSDALVMLKNGNTTLNGQLTLSDGANPFTLPNTDGANGQVLVTDGAGALAWQNPSSAFSSVSNIISNSDPANESFLVGSVQFNDDGDASHGSRMFFEKSTGAFRVGGTSTSSWDTRGNYSFAAGRNNRASGNYSTISGGRLNIANNTYATVVGGYNNRALGVGSFAGGGYTLRAIGQYSTVSGGNENYATGNFSAIIGGRGLTAYSFGEVAMGVFNTEVSGNTSNFISTDRLFTIGNGSSGGARSDALIMLKNGNTTLNGSLEVNTTTGAFLLPRMTTTERDAITSPVNGMLIYNTTTNQIEGYENGTWIDI